MVLGPDAEGAPPPLSADDVAAIQTFAATHVKPGASADDLAARLQSVHELYRLAVALNGRESAARDEHHIGLRKNLNALQTILEWRPWEEESIEECSMAERKTLQRQLERLHARLWNQAVMCGAAPGPRMARPGRTRDWPRECAADDVRSVLIHAGVKPGRDLLSEALELLGVPNPDRWARWVLSARGQKSVRTTTD